MKEENSVSNDLRGASLAFAKKEAISKTFPDDELEIAYAFEKGAKWKTEQLENEHWQDIGEITMDSKDFDTISEDTAQDLLDSVKGMNDALKGFEDTWQRNYGVLVDEIKLKCAEKLIFYTDKYAQATFLTRWYWKRKMEKFVKGIDVLKEL